MLNKINNFYKKYEGIIKLLVMAAPLAFALWKYFNQYIDVPIRMDAFESRAKRDSLGYARIIEDNHRTDSIQSIYINYMYNEIQKQSWEDKQETKKSRKGNIYEHNHQLSKK